MVRKSFWMIPVILLFTALGSTSARADAVVTNGSGFVSAIDGITLNGTLYNVTFTSTIDDTFAAFSFNSPTIIAVENAINSDLGGTLINDAAGGTYAIAASNRISATDDFAFGSWGIGTGDSTAFYTSTLQPFSNGLDDFYANFNPAVVATPEPGTAPLTLAGVGVIAVLMWKRRQVARLTNGNRRLSTSG